MKARLTTLVNTLLAPGRDRPPRGMTASSATVAPAQDALISPFAECPKQENLGIRESKIYAAKRLRSVFLRLGCLLDRDLQTRDTQKRADGVLFEFK
jgi:hypothetical protein